MSSAAEDKVRSAIVNQHFDLFQLRECLERLVQHYRVENAGKALSEVTVAELMDWARERSGWSALSQRLTAVSGREAGEPRADEQG